MLISIYGPSQLAGHYRLLVKRLQKHRRRRGEPYSPVRRVLTEADTRTIDSYEWLLASLHAEVGQAAYTQAVTRLAAALGVALHSVREYLPIDPPCPPTDPPLRTAYVSSFDGSLHPVQFLSAEGGAPPTHNWVYIRRNRHFSDLLPSLLTISCECPPYSTCSDPRLCPCAQYSSSRGRSSNYTGSSLNKRLSPSVGSEATSIYECSERCHCDRNQCSLTFFSTSTEKCVGPPLALAYDANTTQWGTVALRDISEGEFVLEVTGEIVPQSEAASRAVPCLPLGLTGESLYLDNRCMGNLGRFLVPSKAPCLQLVRAHLEHKDPRLSRLTLFAGRAIAAKQWLTADLPYEQLA